MRKLLSKTRITIFEANTPFLLSSKRLKSKLEYSKTEGQRSRRELLMCVAVSSRRTMLYSMVRIWKQHRRNKLKGTPFVDLQSIAVWVKRIQLSSPLRLKRRSVTTLRSYFSKIIPELLNNGLIILIFA